MISGVGRSVLAFCVAAGTAFAAGTLQAQAPAAGTGRPSASPPAHAPFAASRAAGPILEAERLLAAGRADQAWRMLEARTAEFAGDPDFDYVLGLAALDSGRPGQAIFALERVLLARPDFLPARAEIAKAYYMVNEHENARREFEAVAGQRIPEAARRTIGRYLDAIVRAEAGTRGQLSMYAEIEGGFDSNVNFGSMSGHWLLADGTAVTPLPASRPRPSGVMAGALGLSASGPVSASVDWSIGARASARLFPNVPSFDQMQLDVSGGLTLRDDCHRYTALALLQHLQLDASAFRNATGGVLQWQCELNSRTLVGASLQGYRFDFPGAEIRDARRTAVGVDAAHVLATAGRPIVIGALTVGEETSRRGLDNLSHDFLNLRAGVVAELAPRWRVSASVGWEHREFGAAEPLFGVLREDRQTEVRVDFERRIDANTSVVPQIVHTRNKSTLAPNDFHRMLGVVQLRHRF